jgi:hypothetical protein
MIGWAVAHPGAILRHVYIEVSFLPPWLSLLSWFLSTALGMVALVVAFGLALQRRFEDTIATLCHQVPGQG